MKIKGLPEYFGNYYLAYFNYAGTGEGKTIEAEILCSKKQKAKIGWPPDFEAKKIPLVIKKKFMGQPYLDYNPAFKAKFYEVFGVGMWGDFMNVVSAEGFINLTVKMHYNFS